MIVHGVVLAGALACPGLPEQGVELSNPGLEKTFKVFLLAGQSNMEGHAVVDLDHPEHYNGGRGNLERTLAANPEFAERFRELRDREGDWSTRDDVWCWYQPWRGPLKAGPLSIGFAVYEGDHHFGPELGIGMVLGGAIEDPILLVKTAWGGKSLQVDFRPPSREGGRKST